MSGTHSRPDLHPHRTNYVSNRVIACIVLLIAVLLIPYGALLLLPIAVLTYQAVKHARRKPTHL